MRIHILSSSLLLGTLITASNSSQAIISGDPVGECGHPNVLVTSTATGFCSAGLVHPQVISTARHCGTAAGDLAFLGDSVDDLQLSIRISACWSPPESQNNPALSNDLTFCVLNTAIMSIPPAPVIFGCEIDEYLTPGRSVDIVGFGATAFGPEAPTGVKHWAEVDLQAENPQLDNVAIVGEAGGPSPCPGDSGGPGMVRVDDGSWRTFGVVSRGTTGLPCNGEAGYALLPSFVNAFERSDIGIDITPCFDSATGAWEGGEDCGNFYAGNATGNGLWANRCEGVATVEQSFSCVNDDNNAQDNPMLDPPIGDQNTNASNSTGGGMSAWSLLGLLTLLGANVISPIRKPRVTHD